MRILGDRLLLLPEKCHVPYHDSQLDSYYSDNSTVLQDEGKVCGDSCDGLLRLSGPTFRFVRGLEDRVRVSCEGRVLLPQH